MSEMNHYKVVLANTMMEFEAKLNEWGEQGYRIDRFVYTRKSDYHKQEREYIAIMRKPGRY